MATVMHSRVDVARRILHVQYCIVLNSTVQYRAVLYSTIQYCAVLYSTVQYCTAETCSFMIGVLFMLNYCAVLYSIVARATQFLRGLLNSYAGY